MTMTRKECRQLQRMWGRIAAPLIVIYAVIVAALIWCDTGLEPSDQPVIILNTLLTVFGFWGGSVVAVYAMFWLRFPVCGECAQREAAESEDAAE